MTRYCPKCGEAVPTNSLTCPKCYSKLPTAEPSKENKQTRSRTQKTRRTRLLLTTIPALFGFLGLGHIYRNYKNPRGYFFLAMGMLFFFAGNTLLFLPVFDFATAALKTLFGLGLLGIYFLLFLWSLFESLMDFSIVVR